MKNCKNCQRTIFDYESKLEYCDVCIYITDNTNITEYKEELEYKAQEQKKLIQYKVIEKETIKYITNTETKYVNHSSSYSSSNFALGFILGNMFN